jgi:hypothetical protein
MIYFSFSSARRRRWKKDKQHERRESKRPIHRTLIKKHTRNQKKGTQERVNQKDTQESQTRKKKRKEQGKKEKEFNTKKKKQKKKKKNKKKKKKKKGERETIEREALWKEFLCLRQCGSSRSSSVYKKDKVFHSYSCEAGG